MEGITGTCPLAHFPEIGEVKLLRRDGALVRNGRWPPNLIPQPERKQFVRA